MDSIADNQGWKWVFYWPTIFLGVALVWCFFLLEETNYERATVGVVESNGGNRTPTSASPDVKVGEKVPEIINEPAAIESGTVAYRTNKSFLQKLSLWYTTPGENMLARAFRSLRYLTCPVIFYSGFSYGSYLVGFLPCHQSACAYSTFSRSGSTSSMRQRALFSADLRITFEPRWSDSPSCPHASV